MPERLPSPNRGVQPDFSARPRPQIEKKWKDRQSDGCRFPSQVLKLLHAVGHHFLEVRAQDGNGLLQVVQTLLEFAVSLDEDSQLLAAVDHSGSPERAVGRRPDLVSQKYSLPLRRNVRPLHPACAAAQVGVFDNVGIIVNIGVIAPDVHSCSFDRVAALAGASDSRASSFYVTGGFSMQAMPRAVRLESFAWT